MEKARGVIRQWLAQKGMPMPELVMENGSGLSRIERISARSMGEMLLDAFRSPVDARVHLVDADRRGRRHDAQAPRRTPTSRGRRTSRAARSTGVRAIAGYVLDAQGRRVVVVFIVNHANAGNAQAAQDALLRWVYRR